MQRALELGKVAVHSSHARFSAELMTAAKRVRDNKWNWIPLYVMIDKSLAELKAILAGMFCYCTEIASYRTNALIVWPGITVRLCQFHVIQASISFPLMLARVKPIMQAIIRWDRDHETNAARPKLSRDSKDKLLHAVRELQRCCVAEDWAAEVEKFKTRIASFTDASTAHAIILYFERNWFIDLWRGV